MFSETCSDPAISRLVAPVVTSPRTSRSGHEFLGGLPVLSLAVDELPKDLVRQAAGHRHPAFGNAEDKLAELLSANFLQDVPFLKPGAFRTTPGALPNGPEAPGTRSTSPCQHRSYSGVCRCRAAAGVAGALVLVTP